MKFNYGDIKPPKEDAINPSYYNEGDISTIDYIEAKMLGFHLGNAVKYISRAGKKGGYENRIEDIKKAIWYLKRYVHSETERDKKFREAIRKVIDERG